MGAAPRRPTGSMRLGGCRDASSNRRWRGCWGGWSAGSRIVPRGLWIALGLWGWASAARLMPRAQTRNRVEDAATGLDS